MSNNPFDIPPPSTALDGAIEKELNWQKAYNNSQRPTPVEKMKNNDDDDEYSKAQQANQITLQQIKDEKQWWQQKQQQQHATPRTRTATPTTSMTTSLSEANKKSHQDVVDVVHRFAEDEENDDEGQVNENEHLLGGQEQQQPTTNSATVQLPQARAIFKGFKASLDSDKQHEHNLDGEAYPLQAGNPINYSPVRSLGSKQDFIGSTEAARALKAHDKFELEKFPKEMTQSQNNINEQNGSTIILNPTLLTSTATAAPATATATATATDGQNVTNNGNSVGGGGGQGPNAGGGGAVNTITSTGCCDDGVYQGPKIWQYLVKHYPVSSQPLAIFIIFLGLWALGYVLMPDYAVPHTVIMRIAFLFVGAQISGILVTFLKLPDMLGMLFFGVLYTNVGLADFSGYQKLEAFLREMALINIMLLAGLGLDADAFKKLWFMILRLTLIPTIAEVAIIAVLAHFLLHMSWLWGILLGLVITAVSPNVVVTVMLKLKEERLGLNSGIHTLIYAMTTCNDVVAIFLFGVFCGVIFSTGSLTEQILQGPIGIGIGIVFGSVYGLMLTMVPSRNSAYVNGLRFILTILGGAIAVMGSKAIGYPSAGALGCVTVSFIAGIGWKRQMEKLTPQQLQAYENSNVGKRLDLLWKFLKPVSFSLIGKEINFAVLDGKVVGYGALLVILGSVFRLAFAYLSTYGGNLTRKERGYITISGFPKATVQAALGPIALDLARSMNADGEQLSLASNVLIISVLAIIFTAPLGAILMLRLAPVWLQYTPPTTTTTMTTVAGAANNDYATDDNRRCTGYTANNLHMIESAGNINFDRNQKSI